MPTNYTGSATATQSPGAQPAPGVVPVVALPVDADALNSASIYQPFKELADYVAYLMRAGGGALFGDGSDGNCVVDGGNTFSWASKNVSTYTLLRDVQAQNLTVTGANVFVLTNGFRIFTKGTLTTSSGGLISGNGVGRNANTTNNTVAMGGNGGISLNGLDGNAGTNTAHSLGGAGGAGGGGADTNPGAGGVASALTDSLGNARLYSPQTFGHVISAGGGNSVWYAITGGGGGGGGGSHATTFSGGNGGAAGGVLAVAAKTLALANATDLLVGGSFGANGNAGASTGGGGGGGGGVLLLVYRNKNAVTFSAAANAPGGAGGSGGGAGAAGSSGSNGSVIEINLGDL